MRTAKATLRGGPADELTVDVTTWPGWMGGLPQSLIYVTVLDGEDGKAAYVLGAPATGTDILDAADGRWDVYALQLAEGATEPFVYTATGRSVGPGGTFDDMLGDAEQQGS
jgi:hypothetical protein